MTPKDILQLESTDIRQAYLFEENGHWYAYEHSANRIEKGTDIHIYTGKS